MNTAVNLHAAWAGLLLGCVAGAVPGLFFHREGWLGGYGSWRRRMIRLAHISLFGIGFLNLGFALSVRALELRSGVVLPSRLLLLGAVTMPLVCYLSAIDQRWRALFFVPASAVTLGVALFLARIVFP